ncbi:MAG: EAL domain-containing protein [Lachnospiraceae bacterium]|nr:EAL domain-containing protein [Lachnospiraceae bacterium]
MWDKILFLDICSAPIYLIIWCATIYRRMTRGRSNRLYLWLTAVAFITVLSEITAGICMYSFPLSPERVEIVSICECIYFIARNATNMFYVFFIFSITESWFRIDRWWKKLLLVLPYLGILITLFFHPPGWQVFTVTAEDGYARGRGIYVIYLLATIYLLFGASYLLRVRRTIENAIWLALFSLYALNVVGVIIQYFFPDLLVECYFTSMTLLFIVFFVQRPEKLVDPTTGLPSYPAFRERISRLSVMGQHVQVGIISMVNAGELRLYLGAESFFNLIYTIDAQIRAASKKERLSYSMYFENPGTFYFLLEDVNFNPVHMIPEIRDQVRGKMEKTIVNGAYPDIRIVLVDFPHEMANPRELFRFGHTFTRFADPDKIFSRGSSIISLQEYQVETHIDEILNRTIDSQNLQVLYQPVWSVKEERFASATARIRVHDEEFGDIHEKLLLRAAEERGVIIALGSYVLEQVFAFVSDEAFAKSGFRYVAINLSPTECMQMNLTDQIWQLREKYRIQPRQIEFIIRESVYENVSHVFQDNIEQLAMQGYRITLGSFGKGYSDMRHIISMPLSAVKLDKSIILASTSEKGRALLRGSISIIRNIPLEVASKGADDPETAQMLIDMGCELLEGEYYCKPLPQQDLLLDDGAQTNPKKHLKTH